MGLAFVPFYITYLGPEAFGIVGFVALVQAFMGVLDLGMTPTLTREAARYEAKASDTVHIRDLLRSVEIVTLFLSVAIFVSIAMASSLVSNYWMQAEDLLTEEIAAALSIAAAVIAFRFFETIYRGSLYGLQRQVLANIIAAVMATLRAGGSVILLAFFAADIEMFFVWQACVSVLTILALGACVYSVIPKTHRGGRFSIAILSSVWRFAFGMFAISLLSVIATQGDKVLLSALIPLDDFGFYVFATKVASIVMIVSGPIFSAVYPKLVQHVSMNDEVEVISKLHQFAKIIVCLTAPIAIILSLFSQQVIFVWSGDHYLATRVGPPLSLLVLGTFLHAQCILPYQVQLAYGWTSLSVWTNLASVFLVLVSVSFFVPLYGAISAAWIWVTLASLYFLVSTNFTFFRYIRSERFAFYVRDVGIPTGVAFVTAYSLKLLLSIAEEDRFVMLLSILFAFGVTFAATSLTAFFLDRRRARRVK